MLGGPKGLASPPSFPCIPNFARVTAGLLSHSLIWDQMCIFWKLQGLLRVAESRQAGSWGGHPLHLGLASSSAVRRVMLIFGVLIPSDDVFTEFIIYQILH